MNRWLAAATVGLVFFAGVGVGTLATLAISNKSPGPLRSERPRLLLDERRLQATLDLTGEQMEALAAARHRAEERLSRLHPRVRSEVDELRDAHLAEIRQILDDDQRREFEDLLRERRRHRRRGR